MHNVLQITFVHITVQDVPFSDKQFSNERKIPLKSYFTRICKHNANNVIKYE